MNRGTHFLCNYQSPEDLLSACQNGAGQQPLSCLLGVESSKLWGRWNFSRGFVCLFVCFTERHSWTFFPRYRHQRLQSDTIGHQLVALRQFSKSSSCLVFHQKRLVGASSCFAEICICFCAFHREGWEFAVAFQATSSQLSYSLG